MRVIIASIVVAGIVGTSALAAAGSAQAAGFDCKKFEQQPDGTWKVLEPLEIRGPRGRIDFTPDEIYKPGQEKMGLDLAKLLDANCAKK